MLHRAHISFTETVVVRLCRALPNREIIWTHIFECGETVCINEHVDLEDGTYVLEFPGLNAYCILPTSFFEWRQAAPSLYYHEQDTP